ncbi:trypsin-like peptidase domain-containing protein [Streptomyces collinus]|uniref:trypsin-like peptidase domain-containing protein n=1 Tax=Streptomyces collinus TaxID=42684 RepID=UPI00379436EB
MSSTGACRGVSSCGWTSPTNIAPGGQGTLGTGFFVAYGKVLTCAHVVCDSSTGIPLEEVLVVPDPSLRSEPVAARVVACTEPPTQGVLWPLPDLALLELESDLHHEVLPLRLQRRLAVGGWYQAWGYAPRADGEVPDGAPVSFRFDGHEGDGYLRLAAGQAAAGLSGSPLVDAARPDEVLGVIAASRDVRTDLGGWAAPVAALEDPGLTLPGPLRDVLWENSLWEQDTPLPAPENVPVPPSAVLRRSYHLGSALARLGRMESVAHRYREDGQESAERERYIAKYRAICADACRFLSVVAPPGRLVEEEEGNDATVARIGHANRIAGQLRREHGERGTAEFGARVATAHQLGLKIGVSPAMLPHLSPEQRAESTRGLLALASELELPRELVERAGAMAGSTGQETMQEGAFAFDDEVSLWYEHRARRHLWARLSLCTLWRMAWRACLAALARSELMAPGLVGGLMGRARGYGARLDLPVANLPEATENPAEDGAHAMHYLLHRLPDPLLTVLRERYGQDPHSLMWICTRLVGWLIFSDDGLRESIASGVERRCASLGFPDDLPGEVVAALRSGQDFGIVKNLVWEFNQKVNEFYYSWEFGSP